MQYRKLGKTGLDVSVLGFGLMRLPTIEDTINKEETEKLFQYALEKGVNYFDTAWPYHNEESEVVFGELISPEERKKIYLTTKMPIWLIESFDDFDKYLDEQLRRLNTDYLDAYLLHAIFTDRWETVRKFKAIDWLESAKKDGRIKHIGFSFHDSFELFKTVIEAFGGWDIVQIQYNYLNENVQAGTKGLKYAAEKEKGIVVMEPLYGGQLVNPPDKVKQLLEKKGKKAVPLALNWLWNKPEIATILSGMTTMEQLKENISLAENALPGTMSAGDLEVIKEAAVLYSQANPIPCTKCKYCLPCPQGVDIPRNFEVYNEAVGSNALRLNRAHYTWHMNSSAKAAACTGCGECESKCPQKIKIAEWMPKIDKVLAMPE